MGFAFFGGLEFGGVPFSELLDVGVREEECNPISVTPPHNLSGNGRAATSRNTGVINQDLGASRGATRG